MLWRAMISQRVAQFSERRRSPHFLPTEKLAFCSWNPFSPFLVTMTAVLFPRMSRIRPGRLPNFGEKR
uniref:Uncharacterized protein n=1 Tax=Picea sitchensis TaxID=3332 RepID=A9NL26_PICSI|nr:unknown [Picea sitchensis]